MGFTSFSSDAGLDRKILEPLVMELYLQILELNTWLLTRSYIVGLVFDFSFQYFRFMHSFHPIHCDERHIGPCL